MNDQHFNDNRNSSCKVISPSIDTPEDDQNDAHKKTALRFTPHEDMIIKRFVLENGAKNWKNVIFYLPDRTPRQCRDRYSNYLRPGLTISNWTPEEELLLHQKVAELGQKWTKIAKFFKGRSTNCLKNHWNYKKSHKLKSKLNHSVKSEEKLNKQYNNLNTLNAYSTYQFPQSLFTQNYLNELPNQNLFQIASQNLNQNYSIFNNSIIQSNIQRTNDMRKEINAVENNIISCNTCLTHKNIELKTNKNSEVICDRYNKHGENGENQNIQTLTHRTFVNKEIEKELTLFEGKNSFGNHDTSQKCENDGLIFEKPKTENNQAEIDSKEPIVIYDGVQSICYNDVNTLILEIFQENNEFDFDS